MKGSPYRKRYFLLQHNEMDQFLKTLADDLFHSFRCRLRFNEGQYAIFLTDQFRKLELSEYMSEYYGDVRIVTVSGTIRKCKKVIVEETGTKKEQVTA
ncbi:MAG: hypothetical protein QW597_04120 [Thermoplasmataceae archaeon]